MGRAGAETMGVCSVVEHGLGWVLDVPKLGIERVL